MTPADLRPTAEALGSHERLARVLGVHPRTVDNWVAGAAPAGARVDWLARVVAITAAPTPERPGRVVIDLDA